MKSVKPPNYNLLTSPTPAELFSPMEVYHENSKLQPSDYELFSTVNLVNTSADIRHYTTRPFVNYPGNPTVPLAANLPANPVDFETVLRGRRSEHAYSGQSMSFEHFSRILTLGDGIVARKTIEEGNAFSLRTAPSGGGLNPVEIYPIVLRVQGVAPGIYFFNPDQNQLEQLSLGDFTADLCEATNMQDEIRKASACFALVGVMPRTSFKYGHRAYRFVLLEAGHIAQNILLAGESMNLGGLPLGGFTDDKINGMLKIDGCTEITVYLVLVGEKGAPAR